MINDIIFNKWKSEYIDDVDLDNIEYLNLTPNELNKFLNDNYLDKSIFGYVSSQEFSSKPIGLVYLDYAFLNSQSQYEKEKRFLIGIVSNNKGTKTIISVFKYYDKYFFTKEQKIPLTYILSVEVNEFFRKKGLYKKLIFESLNHINPNNPIIISTEADYNLYYLETDGRGNYEVKMIESQEENKVSNPRLVKSLKGEYTEFTFTIPKAEKNEE